MIIDVKQISTVYGQLDPPLWLVTAAHGGRYGGFIATTVAQASIVAEMSRQLITVNNRHNTHALIEGSGAFAMHLIDETQLDLVWMFGLQSGRDVDKFAGLQYQTGATGSPLLPEALAWFDCRVEARLDSGDRTVYLAAVVDGRARGGTGNRQRQASALTANKLRADLAQRVCDSFHRPLP